MLYENQYFDSDYYFASKHINSMRLINQLSIALLVAIIVILTSCSPLSGLAQFIPKTGHASPAPAAPVTITTLRVFNYFWSLNGTAQGILGQNFIEGNHWVQDYATVIAGFYAAYGKYPALATTEFYQNDQASIDLGTAKLTAFFEAGGLVGANWMFKNPFTGQNSWDTTQVDGKRLLPGGDLRAAWTATLDEVAVPLTALSKAGVPVLWRPMQEMNGHWFWWGNLTDDDFKAIWRDMFVYFRDVKKLDNLLWIYSTVNGDMDYTAKYPGSAYVDFTSFNFYSNSYRWINMQQYRKLVALGKPVFVSEAGPDTQNKTPRDLSDHLIQLQQRCPEVHLITFWHSWRDDNGDWLKISLVDNLGAEKILADPWTLTRDELPKF